MRRVLLLLSAAVLLMSVAAPAAATEGHGASRQSVDVFTFDEAEDDVGDARLIRTSQGVVVVAAVSDDELSRGDTSTMWWVVWNDWQDCPSGACGSVDSDFDDPALVGLDIGYATGKVVRHDGRLYLTAWLPEGGLSGFPSEYGITTGRGLEDAQTAEIHIVLRSHGPSQPGNLRAQVGTYMGGCDYTGSDLVPDSYGDEGDAFACFDSHFSVFPGI